MDSIEFDIGYYLKLTAKNGTKSVNTGKQGQHVIIGD